MLLGGCHVIQLPSAFPPPCPNKYPWTLCGSLLRALWTLLVTLWAPPGPLGIPVDLFLAPVDVFLAPVDPLLALWTSSWTPVDLFLAPVDHSWASLDLSWASLGSLWLPSASQVGSLNAQSDENTVIYYVFERSKKAAE